MGVQQADDVEGFGDEVMIATDEGVVRADPQDTRCVTYLTTIHNAL